MNSEQANTAGRALYAIVGALMDCGFTKAEIYRIFSRRSVTTAINMITEKNT